MTEPRAFDWNIAPSHDPEYRQLWHAYWSQIQARIAADRVLRNPADDHRPNVWPPAGPLAPLVDLALEPMPRGLAATWHPFFASRPAGAASLAHVLARGTRMRPTHHSVDPYQSGCDVDGFEILEGPNVGRELALCCNGGWSSAAMLADALLADAAEPIFADPEAGTRLIEDLRAITDRLRALAPGVGR